MDKKINLQIENINRSMIDKQINSQIDRQINLQIDKYISRQIENINRSIN